jgi:uncharacterized surface protein with fasciclin (FAS1) repeats
VTTPISQKPDVFIGPNPNPLPPTEKCVPSFFRECPGRRLQVGTPDGPYPKAPLPDSGPADRRRLVIRRANLLNLLDDRAGNFTLFAPRNNAFGFLPRELIVLLYRPDNAFLPHLEDLLLYHGLDDRGRLESDFMAMETIQTLNSEGLLIMQNPFRVNQIFVSTRFRDLPFANGVTQVITGVLRPEWVTNSIFAFLVDDDDLSTLRGLLVITGLDNKLDRAQFTESQEQFENPFTLVAPTNNAFVALGDAAFLATLSQEALINILDYHIIKGVFASPELSLRDGENLETEEGTPIEVSVISSLDSMGMEITEFLLNDNANVVMDSDGRDSILANNGVLYKIDAVLNPDSMAGF